MSIKINLPNLAAGINIPKDTPFDSPKGYVSVINGYAIMSSDNAAIVFNLRDYFYNQVELPEDDKEYFDILMDWMDGKFFNQEFWKEISGLKNITVLDESTLQIENEGYSKNLNYTHKTVLIEQVLKVLNRNIKTKEVSYPCVAYPAHVFNYIQKTLGNTVRTSSIILQFVEKEKPARFIFDKHHFAFGVITPNHSPTEEQFIFLEFEEFCEQNPVE